MHLTSFVERDDGTLRAIDLEETPDGYEIHETVEFDGDPGFRSGVALPRDAAVRFAHTILGQMELSL